MVNFAEHKSEFAIVLMDLVLSIGVSENGWPTLAVGDVDRLLDLGGGEADKILFHLKQHVNVVIFNVLY
jgi:hypothetical protein